MDFRAGGVGDLSYHHFAGDGRGRFGAVARGPRFCLSLCMDGPAFSFCGDQSFVVGIDMAVRSRAARSVMYENNT